MRIAAWWLSASLLSAQFAGVGQPERPQRLRPEVKPEDRCTVEGTVLNAATKEPVKKAQVMLVETGGPGGPPLSATTDGDGRFQWTGVEPGQYRLDASRNGFARFFGSRSGKTPSVLTLTAKQTLKDITIELVPAAVITGRVVDEDGEPLANVRIEALRWVVFQGTRRLTRIGGSASTDDTGAYRMFGLDPGRYYLDATYEGMANALGTGGAVARGGSAASGPQAYPPVYYPGVADPSQAVPVQVKAGEELRGVDMQLAPVRTVRVRGRITPIPVRPQQVSAWLTPRREGRVTTRLTAPVRLDAKGAFEVFGVMPGSYILTAKSGGEGNYMSARTQVEVGSANVDGLELTLRAAAEVRGRVRFEGDPDPNAKSGEMQVFLSPATAADALNGSRSAMAEGDGSFTVRGVEEGEYRVSVVPLGQDVYIKAVRLGETDVTKSFGVAGPLHGIDVVLSNTAGSVEGVVKDDDKPVAGAVVTVADGSGALDASKFNQTDQDGRFTVRGLAPGEYKLCAWQDRLDAYSADTQRLESAKDKAKTVTIEPKTRATADLTLIPSGNP